MPSPHRPRPRPRIAGHLALLGLAALVACTAELRDPTRFLQPGSRGQTGTGGSTTALVGTWQAFILIAVPTDVQAWVTTWELRADGRCHFRREVTSALEGVTRVLERDCTWTTSGNILTAIYTDTGEHYPMVWSFKALDTGILVLEGVEYRRLAG
jgi:hypothetical protein